jgi:aryl-alcohol dehydrogenase-like predicted oxidoreductase
LPAERRDDALSDKVFDRVEALDTYARDHGHTLLELAIGALVSQQAVVSVIASATTPEQVRANAAAAGWRLTAEELSAIPS